MPTFRPAALRARLARALLSAALPCAASACPSLSADNAPDAIAGGHAAPPIAAKPPDARDLARARATADAMLAALLRVNGVPGMGAAVWRDGALVWTGCAGWRDVDARLPVDSGTVFRLASVSKVFTATAAARLAEQGRLDLDAPVADSLPWLRAPWAPLSVRQLAAHVSGLAHYRPGDEAFGQRHFATGRDAVRLFASRPLLTPPGAAYRYSSWGYTLIGAVIEARAQAPFLDYLAREIVPGLRIGADTGGVGRDVSRLYAIAGGTARALPPEDMSYTWGGGGLAGTAADVARFGGRLMQGRIVSPTTWAAMRTPLRLAGGGVAGERDYAVGLGWRVGADDDGDAIAHHAGNIDGGRSALVLWPQERTGVSLLSNAQWVSSIDRSAMLLAAPFRPAPADLRAAACPLAARRYEGHLGDASISGAVRFRRDGGRCVGVLAPGGALAAAFSDATAWPGRRLELVSMDAGLSRAALVGPYGLYDLRADAGGWRARLAKDTLRLAFAP